MIEFVVCDDNEMIRKNIVNIINKLMMKNDQVFKISRFGDYNDAFISNIKKKGNSKIYILDIETPTKSGIDVARLIRSSDKDSSIIFLTSHDELGYLASKSRLNFLNFISKFDDYETNLLITLEDALKYIGVKRYYQFSDHGIGYNILISNILYVMKDGFDRKSIIKTDNSEYRIYKPLTTIMNDLDGNFRQTHRACIVNTNRVESINYNKNEIIFDNGLKIDLLSVKYRKELTR